MHRHCEVTVTAFKSGDEGVRAGNVTRFFGCNSVSRVDEMASFPRRSRVEGGDGGLWRQNLVRTPLPRAGDEFARKSRRLRISAGRVGACIALPAPVSLG